MTVDVVDEEMIVDQEVVIVEEEVDMIAVVSLIGMIVVVEATDTTEIDMIEAMVEIAMIRIQEDVEGTGLLLVATVGHHLQVTVVAVAPVPDRPEAVVEEDTDLEVHREEAMMIATGDDMMITGTTVVAVGAQKTTGVGEVLTEGMVALSVLRGQVCFEALTKLAVIVDKISNFSIRCFY